MSAPRCGCGRPTNGIVLCERCRVTLAYAITNVGIYYADLDTVAGRATRYGGAASKGSIGKTQPLPVDMRFVNQTVDDDEKIPGPRGARFAPGAQLRRDVETTVARWSTRLASERPIISGPVCVECRHPSCADIRRRDLPVRTVVSRLLYLARNHRYVITRDWADPLLSDLRALELRLTRMVDRPPERWYAGICSAPRHELVDGQVVDFDCDTDLYAEADRGTITCPTCGAHHDVADRRDFLLDRAQDAIVTATQAATALVAWTDYDGSPAKLVDRIRKWRDREHDPLEVVDVTSLHGRDRHLYRLGDIQDLLTKTARDTQQRTIGA